MVEDRYAPALISRSLRYEKTNLNWPSKITTRDIRRRLEIKHHYRRIGPTHNFQILI